MSKSKSLIAIIIIAFLFSCRLMKDNERKQFKIITSDVKNFWNAYDKLQNGKDFKDSINILQKYYFDKATPEFKKFVQLRTLNAKDFVEHIKFEPKFWKTIRPLTINIENKTDKIHYVYNEMSKLYPEFKAPNICFAISGLQTGGTTSKGLILIGTEIASVNPKSVDISEVNGFMQKVFENSNGDIVAMIAHELVHTQQPDGDNQDESLLSQAIIEGSADFIGSLIYGKIIMNKAIYEYGEKNEKQLWKEFYKDVIDNKSIDDTDWFYDYNSNRPADLGYYLGFKIVESYYNKSKNKKEAIKNIIQMKNPYKFLEKSGYNKNR
jgi:hypothetical protein